MSSVRMRVATKHWCASRSTVSMTSIFPAMLESLPVAWLLVKFALFILEAFLFFAVDDVHAVHFFDLRDVIEIFGHGQAVVELVHLDCVPRADLFVQPVFRFRADQLQLNLLRHGVRGNRLSVGIIEPVGILIKNLAGFLMLLDFRQIVAVTHLAPDALIVVDEYAIGFEPALWQFFVEQIDAIVHRTVGFAYRRAGAARAIFIHDGQKSRSLAFFCFSHWLPTSLS